MSVALSSVSSNTEYALIHISARKREGQVHILSLTSLMYSKMEGMGIHKEGFLGIQGKCKCITLAFHVINTSIHHIQSRITILNPPCITKITKEKKSQSVVKKKKDNVGMAWPLPQGVLLSRF